MCTHWSSTIGTGSVLKRWRSLPSRSRTSMLVISWSAASIRLSGGSNLLEVRKRLSFSVPCCGRVRFMTWGKVRYRREELSKEWATPLYLSFERQSRGTYWSQLCGLSFGLMYADKWRDVPGEVPNGEGVLLIHLRNTLEGGFHYSPGLSSNPWEGHALRKIEQKCL